MLVLLLALPLCWAGPATLDPDTEALNMQVKVFNNSVNVRTVLFKESDTCRICWSKHDLNLLIARRLVQDLLPRKIPKDFTALLKYFTYLLQEVRAKFPQKNFQIMLMAMYDALGGYLYSVVMPVLNEAFYAGNVDYKTVSQLHNMLGLMMDFLATNGNGWAPPCDMSRIPTKVAALPLKKPKLDSPCDAFVIPFLAQLKNKNGEEADFCPEDPSITDSKIQIPFLDDNSYPSAVAVPLKDHPLFSLMSECSVNIIPKYYIMAMRCLSCAPFTNRDVVAFNKNLHRWIVATVVPHLHENSRWYPGFGSIMRVVETMNQRGLASTEHVLADTAPPSCADLPGDGPCGLNKKGPLPLWAWILLVAGLLVLLVLLICLIHCCVYLVKRRRDGLKDCDSDEKVNNPFVNIYCGLKKRDKNKPSSGATSSGKSETSYDTSSED